MKELIDGLLYDTETATKICSNKSEKRIAKIFTWEATLYRTENGRHFVAGHGGPMTAFGKASTSGAAGSEKIIPLEDDHAYELAENVLSIDELMVHFPDKIKKA